MAYFERTGPTTFRPTPHVGGAWGPDEQHVAPALGLLAHVVELDLRERRGGDLVVARLSYDILGLLPLEEVEVAVAVVRPGRTVELVEATASHGGRSAVRLRAWLLQRSDTAGLAGAAHPRLDPPEELVRWDGTVLWPGGFIASVEVRRSLVRPGRATSWVRTPHPLVEGEPVSDLARTAGLLDIANGLAVRVSPEEVAFPNVDLTAHLFRHPRAGWTGFDTSVSFGPDGVGVTSSVLHDADGPFGTLAQVLTVRPGAVLPAVPVDGRGPTRS
ncbi:acyl-CoA thioesterase domain-containing protein [Nocardioides perillae]|uniref:Thioesterase-like superfamily protein n=1 Tax=Nocardioides perillae TaxID=1119534 RepID=A0A7Y9UR27_9ACTN|nr:hypothetical protein [Nocardioides perillae]